MIFLIVTLNPNILSLHHAIDLPDTRPIPQTQGVSPIALPSSKICLSGLIERQPPVPVDIQQTIAPFLNFDAALLVIAIPAEPSYDHHLN